MRVVYFGSYNQDYPRNRILIDGLRLNGVEVFEIHDRSSFFIKYLKLFFKHWPYRHRYDFMVVGFPGFTVMPLARLIATAPVVFDAFSSQYDSNIFDRKIYAPSSLRAKYYYFLDKWACKLADLILVDTSAHIDYFVETFGLARNKFRRIWIGAHDKVFFPQPQESKQGRTFKVLFWGWFIPLQGVEFIVRAAKILEGEDIFFQLIGSGVEKEKMVKLAKELNLTNLEFVGGLETPQILPYIRKADLCLGIFGQTDKTRRVIPNKAYEALACRKPLLTSRTAASEEILKDGEHCLFCRPANVRDLAEKILILKNNPLVGERIAEGGHKLYLEKFNPRALGAELLSILNERHER